MTRKRTTTTKAHTPRRACKRSRASRRTLDPGAGRSTHPRRLSNHVKHQARTTLTSTSPSDSSPSSSPTHHEVGSITTESSSAAEDDMNIPSRGPSSESPSVQILRGHRAALRLHPSTRPARSVRDTQVISPRLPSRSAQVRITTQRKSTSRGKRKALKGGKPSLGIQIGRMDLKLLRKTKREPSGGERIRQAQYQIVYPDGKKEWVLSTCVDRDGLREVVRQYWEKLRKEGKVTKMQQEVWDKGRW